MDIRTCMLIAFLPFILFIISFIGYVLYNVILDFGWIRVLRVILGVAISMLLIIGWIIYWLNYCKN